MDNTRRWSGWTTLCVVLALVSMVSAGFGFSYRIPGGIVPLSYLQAWFSALTLGACACDLRGSSPAERIARFVCGGLALGVAGRFVAAYLEYQVVVYHAYRG